MNLSDELLEEILVFELSVNGVPVRINILASIVNLIYGKLSITPQTVARILNRSTKVNKIQAGLYGPKRKLLLSDEELQTRRRRYEQLLDSRLGSVDKQTEVVSTQHWPVIVGGSPTNSGHYVIRHNFTSIPRRCLFVGINFPSWSYHVFAV